MSKLDITPELAIMAFKTLKEFCASSDDKCRIDGKRCPFDSGICMCSLETLESVPCEWKLPKEE